MKDQHISKIILSNVSTEDLKAELKSRGYQVDNLWEIEDVKWAIEQINKDDDRDTPLVLTESQQQDVLIAVLSSDGVMEAISVAISDYLYEEYPE